MSSYNENLHSSVLESLQSQKIELKQVDSETNASMFALYYAQDAMVTAADKFKDAKTKQDNAEERKKQAVDNSNLSNNLLKSASQANQYMQQSTTNTAVAASNVQLAANSIVKLASDVGSIFNISQAMDSKTEIFTQASEANDAITETAYAAELSSQWAMEASVLAAQVPASTLLDKAKSTNNSMNDLLKILVTDYDNKSQVVSAANATLAADKTSEKSAEGVYEDINAVLKAAGLAYQLTNMELNLGLTAVPEEGMESTNFRIRFDWIRSPFNLVTDSGKDQENLPQYPVQNYYFFVVKDKQKTTFSIYSAENIILSKNSNKFINLGNNLFSWIPWPYKQNSEPFPLGEFNRAFTASELKDSDGDEIQTGTNYTVFIMATYYEEYKKKLNTFDNFLSAPSVPFCLAIQLAKVDSVYQSSKEDTKTTPPSRELQNKIEFSVNENPEYADKVQYRCILLPVSGPLKSEPTEDELNSLKDWQKKWDQLDQERTKLNADHMDKAVKINGYTSVKNIDHIHFRQLEESMIALEKEIDTICGNLVKKSKNKEVKLIFEIIANEEIEKIVKFLQEKKLKLPKGAAGEPDRSKDDAKFITLFVEKCIDKLKVQILVIDETEILKDINLFADTYDNKIDFLFNLTIAEQVSAANYVVADAVTKGKGPVISPSPNWGADIKTGATDNFGNLLGSGKYIPVILSVYMGPDEDLTSYANTWTGYQTNQYYRQTTFQYINPIS